MKRFRGGLVFKAQRLLYHSTLGLRVIKKKKKRVGGTHVVVHEFLDDNEEYQAIRPVHHHEKNVHLVDPLQCWVALRKIV